MSLILNARSKDEVIDLITTILQKLTFHALTDFQQTQAMAHLHALRSLPDDLDTKCTFRADDKTGVTQVVILITPITRLKPNATVQ